MGDNQVQPTSGNPPADIVLIGPVRSGKSTQGKLLAEKLGVPQFSLDKLRWDYFAEIGYDEAEEDRIMEAEGWPGVLAYWKPFEPHALERLLAEHPGGVVDFGCGPISLCRRDIVCPRSKYAGPVSERHSAAALTRFGCLGADQQRAAGASNVVRE